MVPARLTLVWLAAFLVVFLAGCGSTSEPLDQPSATGGLPPVSTPIQTTPPIAEPTAEALDLEGAAPATDETEEASPTSVELGDSSTSATAGAEVESEAFDSERFGDRVAFLDEAGAVWVRDLAEGDLARTYTPDGARLAAVAVSGF